MFNSKRQVPIPTQAKLVQTRVLTPRNIAWDMFFVVAAALIFAMGWGAFTSRAALTDFVRSLQSQQPIEVRAAAVHAAAEDNAQLSVSSLVAMTYDRSSQARADGVGALGERGAIEMLPRIQEVQVVDGNDNVQQAAYRAEDQFRAHIATMLHLPVGSIVFIAATEFGHAYAVTEADLFALRNGEWQFASHLPNTPNGLAVTSDGRVVYLATRLAGLWRSLDQGETWKHIQFGLDSPTRLTVTAVAVNPENAQQIFVALATPGSQSGTNIPLAIFASNDDGESWRLLPDSPMSANTTRLVIHEPWTGYLYGVADGTPWRYIIPIE